MRIRKQERSYDSLSYYYPELRTFEDDLSLNKATTEVLKAIDKEQKKSKEKTVIDKIIQDKLLQKD